MWNDGYVRYTRLNKTLLNMLWVINLIKFICSFSFLKIRLLEMFKLYMWRVGSLDNAGVQYQPNQILDLFKWEVSLCALPPRSLFLPSWNSTRAFSLIKIKISDLRLSVLKELMQLQTTYLNKENNHISLCPIKTAFVWANISWQSSKFTFFSHIA